MRKHSGRRGALRDWKRALRRDAGTDSETKASLITLADAYGHVGADGNAYLSLPRAVTRDSRC